MGMVQPDSGVRAQPVSDPVIEDVLGLVPILRRVRNASVNDYDTIIVEIHSEIPTNSASNKSRLDHISKAAQGG
ncbi:hypothetical protein QR680_007273 [Steinernema hermaphroditum]|uniref:Uncharacterized protein n=1 Tax=Steinernema hermaphroditum TaxID=289476 RepID=A0AA39I0V3_9BILA|nr:hypothetical protein QR680_007273 [Steinernema hermaphroditum]